MNISYVMLSTIIDHEMEIARNFQNFPYLWLRICHYVSMYVTMIAGHEERIEGVWLKLEYTKKKKSFFLGGSKRSY